jgi:hypothetical protein
MMSTCLFYLNYFGLLRIYLNQTWLPHDNFMHYFHALLPTRPAFLSSLAMGHVIYSMIVKDCMYNIGIHDEFSLLMRATDPCLSD